MLFYIRYIKVRDIMVQFIINIVLFVIFGAGVVVLLTQLINKKFALIYFPIVLVGMLLSYIFDLILLLCFFSVALMVGLGISLMINASEFRYIVSKETGLKSRKANKTSMSLDEMYTRIQDAITFLSKNKIGALITFEKTQDLTDIIKNGTRIDAPVSAELLETIFYEGTRLHDGAVVIRNTTIIAASVYYTPTTRPLIGKYGSRHRAAVGISEISDAVTIVVSEETGRISLACNSHLEATTLDTFMEDLKDLMSN